ncbi:Mss4-like protein [Syncephalis fuscata]|nr:Mss4-like protein [Syncephalis fuscata]
MATPIELTRLVDIQSDLSRVLDSGNHPESFTDNERCRCKLLRANAAILVTRDGAQLQVGNIEDISTNRLSNTANAFWMVTDVFAFENMGFSRPVVNASNEGTSAGLRFLCCAECDHGPLGYQDQGAESLTARKECLLSVDRVRYAIQGTI